MESFISSISPATSCVDELVRLAQISGSIDVQCEFRGNWCVQQHTLQHTAVMHIVVEGQAYVVCPNDAKGRFLQAGDVIFFLQGQPHSLMSSERNTSALSRLTFQQKEGITIKRTGETGDTLKLFCAHFRYVPQSILFQNLPAIISLQIEPAQLSPIIQLLKQEIAQHKPSQVVIDSLSIVLLIRLLRFYLSNQPNEVTDFLLGLQDIRLSPVLNAILQDPSQKWTIDRMLSYCALSRVQFIRLFKQHIKESPHRFIQQIRLAYAASLLRSTSDSVLSISLASGFCSETHFIQSFKRHYHITPSRYRHTSS